MASKKTLNATNLAALGAERLAELLIELSTGNAEAKRLLRLELASTFGPRAVAQDVRKRLATIARSRSYVEWDKVGALAKDLDTQRAAIAGKVAPQDPEEALDLMWRFLDLANPVFERCDDSNGRVGDVFHTALADLGAIVQAARPDPASLANRVFTALQQDSYGQYGGLIPLVSPALGPDGIAHLKTRILELAEQPVPVPPKKQQQVIGWGPRGHIYAHEIAERARKSTIRRALTDIADAEGDVEAFIAQYAPKERKVPRIAAEIAQRLLAAGRAEDALKFADQAEFQNHGWIPEEWETARLDALEALGRADDAQAFRQDCFRRGLSPGHLRAYLKRLPDFEDMEAEEEAMEYALRYPSAIAALHFLITWPALERAAQLVQNRADELDGNHYEVLSPAAASLADRHPLAATVLLRAMVDFALVKARSKRYRHAARHLLECGSLAAQIGDFGNIAPHDRYLATLKANHGRKHAFWSHVK